MPSPEQQIHFKLETDNRVDEVVMDRVVDYWKGGLANIEQTFAQVVGLIKEIPYIRRLDLCMRSFHQLAVQQYQGHDMEHYMRQFIVALEPSQYDVADLIAGITLPWDVQDNHLIATLPVAMKIMEGTHGKSFIRKVLGVITHEIMGVACRNEEHAASLLEHLSDYFEPNDQVKVDSANKKGSWVKCWVNHAYQAYSGKCVGVNALAWLVDWGIDVDEVSTDLDIDPPLTELEKALSGEIRHKGEYQLHVVEQLTAAGANWQKVLEGGNLDHIKMLMTASSVKKALLGQVAGVEQAPVSRPKPKI